MSPLSKDVQVVGRGERKSSIYRLFKCFNLIVIRLEPVDGFLQIFFEVIGTDERSIQPSSHLMLRVENSRVLEELDAELAVFEVVDSRSLDGRSTVSLLGLSLNELDDFAGSLEDIARLQVVGMVGTVRTTVMRSSFRVTVICASQRLASRELVFLCLSAGVSVSFLEEGWRFLNLQS